MTTLLHQTLKALRVEYTDAYANKIYNAHPYRYTFYGLQQMLSAYNIEVLGIRVEKQEELLCLDTPFLAELNRDIVLVIEQSADTVTYLWYEETIVVTHSLFCEMTTGRALLLYPNEHSKEINYYKHRNSQTLERGEVIYMTIMLIVGLICLAFGHASSWGEYELLLLGSNLIGMFVTLLIISKTLKGDNLVADKLCDLFSSSSCNDILLSPTAKILGRYGLGEIGFAYFLTSTFFVLLSSKEHLQYLGGITLGTIVFPIWSVWYQKYKAKSWCVLCLLVIGVIVLQIVSSIIHLQWSLIKLPRLLLQGSLWGAVFITFILVVVHTTSKVAWMNRLIAQSRNLVQLKYHPLVWKSLFDAEREVDCDLFTSKICFGDPKAKYQVTLLSNPYCGPCARIHHKIAQLIEAGARVQYVLCAFSDEWSIINKLLIATYLQEGEECAWATFEDWYLGDTSRGRSCFKENLDDTTPEVIEEYAKHQRWQKSAGITTTPTLLLNGRFLPEVYTVDDILFVVQNKL